MHILIAEDEVTIVRALKVMLERNKYAVDVVENGKDALDLSLIHISPIRKETATRCRCS